jgi:hypothetical protein
MKIIQSPNFIDLKYLQFIAFYQINQQMIQKDYLYFD